MNLHTRPSGQPEHTHVSGCSPHRHLPTTSPSPPPTTARFARDVTFTHMDVQSLNILRAQQWDPTAVELIDYEYAGHNPRCGDDLHTRPKRLFVPHSYCSQRVHGGG